MADTTRTLPGPAFELAEDEFNTVMSVRDQLAFINGLLSMCCGGTSSVASTPDELYAFTYELELKMRSVVSGIDARHKAWSDVRLPAIAKPRSSSRRSNLLKAETA